MKELIELALESPDGTVDCRLELQENEAGLFYAATILYPTAVAGGYSRSDIFCHNLLRDAKTGTYFFDESEDIHPKIKRLEAQLSEAVANA